MLVSAERVPAKVTLALCIAVNCIRGGARARFFNVVDLVNQLEAEVRAGQAGKLAGQLARVDLVVLDELGYLPFAQSGGQLLFHLLSQVFIPCTAIRGDDQSWLFRMANGVWRMLKYDRRRCWIA